MLVILADLYRRRYGGTDMTCDIRIAGSRSLIADIRFPSSMPTEQHPKPQ
jgi:hypothetical protein